MNDINFNEIAEKIKAQARKVITLPTLNVPVEIRKLSPADFIGQAKIDLPTEPLTEGEREKAIKESAKKHMKRLKSDPALQAEYVKICISKGVTRPRVLCEDDEVPGEGEVHVRDLAGDLTFLVTQITEFSELGKKAGDAQSFRKN